MSTTDDRYPYTYAAQYIIENLAPRTGERLAQSGTGEAHFEPAPILSLSDADRILTGICQEANLSVRTVAERLAQAYLRGKTEA